MTRKVALSVILNILAVALPTGLLLRFLGVTATVNPESARDILLLVGSTFFSFAVGTISASLMKGGADRSPFKSILLDVLEERGDRERRVA